MAAIQQRKIKSVILIILVFACFLIWSAYFSIRSDNNLQVTFFDVGQGDSTLIETPNQSKIIIDGGPDSSVLAKIGRYFSFYDRTVDIMIITHPDSDHLAGAVEIAKKYEVGLIIINGKECVSSLCGEFEKIVKQKNIKVVLAVKGQEIDLGSGAKIDILMPDNHFGAVAGKQDDNNSSIISLLSFGKDSFLFMGDAENKEELSLIDNFPSLKAGILKVAHHGSKNSANQLFLEKIDPKFSVISVGAKNSYGHPHIEMINELKKIGSDILRTDLEGDIKFISNGEGAVLAN